MLRLPWPVTDGYLPPEGYDTAIRLPLRDEVQAVRLLQEIDPSLLLVLPRVQEVIVEIGGHRRLLRCDWSGDDATIIEDTTDAAPRTHSSWAGVVRRGGVPSGVLMDRPVEERARTRYEIRAFASRDAWPADVPRVVRAPQPTDEPLGLPLVLAAPFPLEAMRRHVVPGPLLDLLLAEAAAAIAALAERLTAQHLPRCRPRPGPDRPAGGADRRLAAGRAHWSAARRATCCPAGAAVVTAPSWTSARWTTTRTTCSVTSWVVCCRSDTPRPLGPRCWQRWASADCRRPTS